MTIQPGTSRQVPDHSIMDFYNKQVYLGNEYVYTQANYESTATVETPLILLSNPAVTATAFPNSYVSLFCHLRKLSTLTTSQTSIFRFYLNPTVTAAGSAASAFNLRPKSPNTGIAVVTTGPTVSANGSFVFFLASNAFASDTSQSLVVLDPGQSLLVTCQTSSSTTFLASELGWYEI